jgi:predicted AlkP superfamily pyrophosphatase or phosphodiesterase
MQRSLRHALTAFVAVALVLSGSQAAQLDDGSSGPSAGTTNGKKVILFIIDGARHTEAFDDTAHRYVPRVWNDLIPQGTLIPEFRNDGRTLTNPGHASMLTGTWQTISNSGSERPTQPTLFEYYRQTHGVPKSETYVISGKGKLDVCSYSTHPDYGKEFGASERVDYDDDQAVFDVLMSVLKTDRPRLVMVCFPTVDITGHSGDWDDYVAALTEIDSLLYELWDFLQSDPFYTDQTYLIVSNDHGRHDDQNGGFENHGDDCEGCRRLMFLALGPDIRPNYTASNVYNQRDICGTVARMLGFPVIYSEGVVIEEIFEDSP